MNITQPAISKSIKALEDELNIQLFLREKRRAVLTENGMAFRKHVLNILEDLDSAVKELSGIGEKKEIKLHVFESGFLLGLLESYLQNNPPVVLRQGKHKELGLYEQLLLGELEFCITNEPIAQPGIERIHLMADKVYLLIPENHRFTGRKSVLPEELKSESFVVPSRSMSDWLEFMGRHYGFSPSISFEVDEMPALMRMVEMGMGIALCSSCMLVRRYTDRVENNMAGGPTPAFIPIEGMFNKRDIGISYFRDHNMTSLSKSFLEFTIKYFAAFEKKIDLI